MSKHCSLFMYLQVVKITRHSLAEILPDTFALMLTHLKVGGIPWQEKLAFHPSL